MGEYIDFNGVRINPKTLIFRNAYEGKKFREKITFQNITSKPITVRTTNPNSYAFKLDNCLQGVTLSCGLRLSVRISHIYSHKYATMAQFTIYVNNESFVYTMSAFRAEPDIYPYPRIIDFDFVHFGRVLYSKTLYLCNKGYKNSKFEFDIIKTEFGLTVKPDKGFIPARGFIPITIEVIGSVEGMFQKEIWIKCVKPFSVTIIVNIIIPQLIVLEPKEYNKQFVPLMFPPTYGNCSNQLPFKILNRSKLQATFVIVPEVNYNVETFFNAIKIEPNYSKVKIAPSDGVLKPDETQEICVSIYPQKYKGYTDKYYFLVYRLTKVEFFNVEKQNILKREKKKQKIPGETTKDNNSIESITTTYSLSTFPHPLKSVYDMPQLAEDVRSDVSTEDIKSDFINICVFASVKPVMVDIQPPVVDMCRENSPLEKIITLTNKSDQLPIYFSYKKVAFIYIEPNHGYIEKLQTVSLIVKVIPKTGGIFENPIHFNLLYVDQPVEKKKKFRIVGSVKTIIKMDIPITTGIMPTMITKFNMGITPKLTNEVGILTNDIRFNSSVGKPRAAMIAFYQMNKIRKSSTSKIAFPNDRPRSLQPWRDQNVKCKTIFAGIERVVAPPDEYMLTPEKFQKKNQQFNYYKEFLQKSQRTKLKKCQSDPIDYIDNTRKLLQTFPKIECPAYLKTVEESMRSRDKALLTPAEIFFIKIQPETIDVGKILNNTHYKYSFELKNENIFPVLIDIEVHRSIRKSLFPNLPLQFLIKDNKTEKIFMEFVPQKIGNFYTILYVYLNNRHVIPVLFKAEVVGPFVSVSKAEIIFDEHTQDYCQQINLYNNLNDAVEFHWIIPEMASYTVQPLQGLISQNMFISCAITYIPSFINKSTTDLSIECKNGQIVDISINASYENYEVLPIRNEIRLPYVPINIPITQTMTLTNYSNDLVLFSVKNARPIQGIDIKPCYGEIFGKSNTDLIITVLMQAFVTFRCKVEIEFHNGRETSFIISGEVEYPKISIFPPEIYVTKIHADSFEIVPFTVQNLCNSPVQLTYLHTIIPEIILSVTKIFTSEHVSENPELFLKPNESAQLFVHFFPNEVGHNHIHLPFLINNILGPTIIFDSSTTIARNFLQRHEIMYEDEHFNFKSIRENLSVLEIKMTCLYNILFFSKSNFEFKYFPNEYFRSVTSRELTIICNHREPVEFAIDQQEITHHFEITPKNHEAKLVNKFIVFSIQPHEEIKLTINFIPTTTGVFQTYVPIYVRNVKENKIFKYLSLLGKYYYPKIMGPKWIFLQPIPTNHVLLKSFEIQINFHDINCKLKTHCTSENLHIYLKKVKNYPDDIFSREMNVELEFFAHQTTNMFTKVLITCNCGAALSIIVTGCADENIATIYAHLCNEISKEHVIKSKSFPEFPDDGDQSIYAFYMRKMAMITERWLFEQVFHYSPFHFQRDSLLGLSKLISKGNSFVLILVNILEHVAGNNVLPFLTTKEMPIEEIAKINYFHETYKHIIFFVKEQGAFMPHVRARYLLSYTEYVTYMTRVRLTKEKEKVKPLDESTFTRISKQCWLDIILQIFRTMILFRFMSRHGRHSRIKSSLFLKIEKNDAQNVLLKWLSETFNQQKNNILKLDPTLPKNFNLPNRILTNFTTNLKDTLVLIAVTLAYCPYLEQHLQPIYINTATDKLIHNAVHLVTCWQMIKSSFRIAPIELINPEALQMLMLVTHLFDILPTLSPKDELNFMINLSDSKTKEISIKNPNQKEKLHYTIHILNNDHDCFSIKNNIIKILPGRTEIVRVTYQAKKLQSQDAILFLCGDTPETQYCRSIVYSLKGKPNLNRAYTDFIIDVKLYDTKHKTFTVKSPYPVEADYNIYFIPTNETLDIDNLNLRSWIEQLSILKPRTMYTNLTVLSCDEKGIGTIAVTFHCLSAKEKILYVFLVNEHVGDFFVKVTIKPTDFDTSQSSTLIVDVPDNWEETKCTCKNENFANPSKCPRRVKITIPCRNDHFWNIVTKAFLSQIPEEEHNTYRIYLENEMGPYLLKWLLGNEIETIKHIVNQCVKYEIYQTNSYFELPPTVTINNIRSPGYIEISIHVLNIAKKHFEFSLQSEDSAEIRWYQVKFRKGNIFENELNPEE